MANAPELSQAAAVTAIAEAEAGILQCMETFLCSTLTVITPVGGAEPDDLPTVKEKIDISRNLICAYSSKEKNVGTVLEGLASKILADKGLVPGGNGDGGDCCGC